LARFRPDPADVAVSELIAATKDRGFPWAAFRASLSQADCYTLMAFARRRAASALRDRSVGTALEAVRALCLVTRDKIDPRDLEVDFPLYAIREVGGDLGAALRFADAHTEPGTRSAFDARALGAQRTTLADCALLPVQSTYGLGFMETWAYPYPLDKHLPERAIACADWIDAGGRYEVEGLHLSELPANWFGAQRRGGPIVLPTNGCVCITGRLRGAPKWTHALLVFLADVGSVPEASSLAARAAEASNFDRPRGAAVSESILILVVGGSVTAHQRPVESAVSTQQLANGLGRRFRGLEEPNTATDSDSSDR
jgi:hypothetical protein